MSTVADKLTALHGIKADLFAATAEKGMDTTGKTLETLHELWSGISGGTIQAKSVVPSSSDVEVTPDAGYNALSAVNIAAALNLKPWNIRKGKTLFGITGTAEIAVSTDVPPDIPAQKDDADDAYKENVGDSPTDSEGNALDMMVLADDDGNITYGYFVDGAGVANGNGTALYNGVELPDIDTVWTDKDTYPYAMISASNVFGYAVLCLSSNKIAQTNEHDYYDFEVGTSYNNYVLKGNSWVEISRGTTGPDDQNGFNIKLGNMSWSNYDILNTDSTVYLAASDPIPLNYNTIIRFDGNKEGLVSDSSGSCFKVSDAILTKDEIVGGYLALCDEGIPSSRLPVTVDMVMETDDGAVWVPNNAPFVVSVPKNNFTIGDITFPEAGLYFRFFYGLYPYLLAYNSTTYPSEFTITRYDKTTTDFSAVGWRRMSYHTTGELAGKWTYDDFSTTPSTGGNYLKNIIQCSREKLYYNGVEVWPNNRYGGEST